MAELNIHNLLTLGRNQTSLDLRSVVEYYLCDRNTSIEDFQLRAVTGGTSQTLATFQVLYLEQHFTGDIGEFLWNDFLTTMADVSFQRQNFH